MKAVEVMEQVAGMSVQDRAFALRMLRTYGDHLETCGMSDRAAYAARMAEGRDCTCGLGLALGTLEGRS